MGLGIFLWYFPMWRHLCFVSKNSWKQDLKSSEEKGAVLCSCFHPSPAQGILHCFLPSSTVSSGGWRATPPEQAYSLVISTHPWQVGALISWTDHQASLQPWSGTAWLPTVESQTVVLEPTDRSGPQQKSVLPESQEPNSSWLNILLSDLFSYIPTFTLVSGKLISLADSILTSGPQERHWHQVDQCHGYNTMDTGSNIIVWSSVRIHSASYMWDWSGCWCKTTSS